MKEVLMINYNVPLTDAHDNANIKFDYNKAINILDSYDHGRFMLDNLIIHARLVDNVNPTSNGYNRFYFVCEVNKDTSFNLSILTNNTGKIDVLDDDFCMPYEYQYKNNNEFANIVLNNVYKIMRYLTEKEIISGWNEGDYI